VGCLSLCSLQDTSGKAGVLLYAISHRAYGNRNAKTFLSDLLALAGLALAVTSLRPPGASRKALAIAARLVCGVQLAASAGLVSPRRFVASLMPGADLPRSPRWKRRASR
jgi:hypothetical protein